MNLYKVKVVTNPYEIRTHYVVANEFFEVGYVVINKYSKKSIKLSYILEVVYLDSNVFIQED